MMSSKLQWVFGLLAGSIVAVAIASGFVILGSPMTERLRRLDERRVDDLRAIRDAVERMVVERKEDELRLKRALPATLDEVAAFVETEEYRQQVRLTDPQTGAKYEYRVTGESAFELCATFSLSREEERDMFWNHPAGRHCFTVDVLERPRSSATY
jgi:hypothetical protein